MLCLRPAGLLAFVMLFSLLPLVPARAAAPTASAPIGSQQALSAGQIDQLVAPVALYPDTLLAKVFMASTYPLEVVEADRWVKANPNLQGSALDSAIAQQGWDDSVKTLAHAPVVLAMMSTDIEKTSKLGEAFLAQQDDVIASVQRLRHQAKAAGKLGTTEQQTISDDGTTIVIAPTQTETVYVPYYTTDVYGPWAWADYPPYWWPAPPGYVYAAGFFTAAIINAAIWNAAIDWRNHHLLVDNNVNFNRSINRNGFISGQTWHHDPEHRQGMNYTRPALQTQFGRGPLADADTRRDFRGFDNSGRDFGDRGDAFNGLGRGADTHSFSDRGFSSFGGRGGGFGGGFGGLRGGFGGRR